MKYFHFHHLPFPFRRFLFPSPSESAVLLTLAISVGLASGTGIWLFTTAVDIFSHLFREQLAGNMLHPGLARLELCPFWLWRDWLLGLLCTDLWGRNVSMEWLALLKR